VIGCAKHCVIFGLVTSTTHYGGATPVG